MNKLKRNDSGFSAVEGILVLLIVGIVGFVGWYVWNQNNKTPNSNNTSANTNTVPTSKPKTSTNSTAPIDKEAQTWILAESKQKGFTIRIPDGWEVVNYGGSNSIRSKSIVYKSGTKAIVESSDSPYAGDSIFKFEVSQYKNSDNFRYLDGDEEKSSFVAGTITGTKYHKTYPLVKLEGVGPIPGEDIYTYEFKTSDKTTYVVYRKLNLNDYSREFLKVNYNQTTSDPDLTQLVERVAKTININ